MTMRGAPEHGAPQDNRLSYSGNVGSITITMHGTPRLAVKYINFILQTDNAINMIILVFKHK